jgi:hypothetical protein
LRRLAIYYFDAAQRMQVEYWREEEDLRMSKGVESEMF